MPTVEKCSKEEGGHMLRATIIAGSLGSNNSVLKSIGPHS